MSRSILTQGIYELWGAGDDLPSLHCSVQSRSSGQWAKYCRSSFRFTIDDHQHKRSQSSQRELIESFAYLPFDGAIKMKDSDEHFVVFEDYRMHAKTPHALYFGRFIAKSGRDIVNVFDLKKRSYISTTSMDAELALVAANLVHAAPGKILYDPFVGTGSFVVSGAHFGAYVLGSDIDGRSIRGKKDTDLLSNFSQYGLTHRYLDSFVGDLTFTPLRSQKRWLDCVICDPPYGVREGLKVLGSRDGSRKGSVFIDGIEAYKSVFPHVLSKHVCHTVNFPRHVHPDGHDVVAGG